MMDMMMDSMNELPIGLNSHASTFLKDLYEDELVFKSFIDIINEILMN